MPCPPSSLSAGVVARFTGVQGVIGMHGGLPPPDAFPFATLGGDLAPDTTTSTAAAPPADGEQLQRLDITDPALVALAQQYIMTPKASSRPASVCLAQALVATFVPFIAVRTHTVQALFTTTAGSRVHHAAAAAAAGCRATPRYSSGHMT